jgi:RimJ/RimL family protein N-acetyltransferase
MEKPDFTLRLYSLWDLHLLHSMFDSEVFLRASGVTQKPFASLLSFWKWLRATFQVIYIIESLEHSGSRTIGFMGLYDMQIGQSLRLSMAIFNPEDRRGGFGRKSLELLFNYLECHALVRVVYAEVLKDNTESFHFLTKFGFDVSGEHKDRLTLERVV